MKEKVSPCLVELAKKANRDVAARLSDNGFWKKIGGQRGTVKLQALVTYYESLAILCLAIVKRL
jgi:hypothetical protein